MDLQIRGKKALMAGGSAGMGRATAERLAEAGVELYISARREERLRNAAKEMSDKYGTAVTPIVADSSTEEGRKALFSACPDPDILAITIKPRPINIAVVEGPIDASSGRTNSSVATGSEGLTGRP